MLRHPGKSKTIDMSEITITIDEQKISAKPGDRLLWVALDAGIEIPNLCARRDREPPFGACRLCYVEVEGWSRPVTSCTVEVSDGMVVKTRTPAIDRLVKASFELLMSHHNLECRKCLANKDCGLQRIAISRKLKLKPKRVPRLEHDREIDDSHPVLRLDRSKCILCGQCVWVCHSQGLGVLDFSKRGLATEIDTFGGLPLGQTQCDSCTNCAASCPTGALRVRVRDEPHPFDTSAKNE